MYFLYIKLPKVLRCTPPVFSWLLLLLGRGWKRCHTAFFTPEKIRALDLLLFSLLFSEVVVECCRTDS